MMDSRKIKTPITYYPSGINRWWPLGAISLFVGCTVLMLDGEPIPKEVYGVLALLLGMCALMVWWLLQSMFYNKLVVWEHGLEVYLDGVHRFVLWEDMARLGTKKRGNSTKRGIYVRRFEREETMLFARIFAYDENFISLNRIVPTPLVSIFNIELDVERFKYTPLGQDLLHFAPHLFDDEKVKHNG